MASQPSPHVSQLGSEVVVWDGNAKSGQTTSLAISIARKETETLKHNWIESLAIR